MPAIKSIKGHSYSELSIQTICDITLSCPKCKETKVINASKSMIDSYKFGAIKISCKCGWVAKFYFAYYRIKKSFAAYTISDKPVSNSWWRGII